MGKYINIGNDGFRKAREGEYVDIERITTNVAHGDKNVAHEDKNVAHEKSEERRKRIKQMIYENPTISRQKLADHLDVSKKTIERDLEKMPDVRYVGSGDKGHWEVG